MLGSKKISYCITPHVLHYLSAKLIVKGLMGVLEDSRVGHSYMYLITHLQRKDNYYGAIYLRNWKSSHLIGTNKYKFCHFR
jgi:hypothetical protein